MSEIALQNPLWSYSLDVYARKDVARLCLQLQDSHGCDVNLLLYGGWLAAQGRTLTRDHLAYIDAGVADWRRRVVQPLRALRRELREFTPAERLRTRIKALELDAERQQQDEMYRLYGEASALPLGQGATQANLELIVQYSVGETRQVITSARPSAETAAEANARRQLRNLALLIAV